MIFWLKFHMQYTIIPHKMEQNTNSQYFHKTKNSIAKLPILTKPHKMKIPSVILWQKQLHYKAPNCNKTSHKTKQNTTCCTFTKIKNSTAKLLIVEKPLWFIHMINTCSIFTSPNLFFHEILETLKVLVHIYKLLKCDLSSLHPLFKLTPFFFLHLTGKKSLFWLKVKKSFVKSSTPQKNLF